MKGRLESVLRDGERLILREEAGVREGWERVHRGVIDSAVAVAGSRAGARLEREGLGVLHEVLDAGAIGALRDEVMPRVRPTLFEITCRVAREVLGLQGEFYVDDYTILRVNYPYEVALGAPMEAENPGIGRVSAETRSQTRAAKIVDPVYDPRGYHRQQPPAAWAHGPHLDTWTGHSRDGINLWWAIGDVDAEHAMFFYPDLFGVPLAPDPASLYLQAGRSLPRPEPVPLDAGELLVFNPEVLHGTHLNVSGRTRIAASTRINPVVPQFDPTCFYAREFWHAASDLERGDLDAVRRFPRAEHLAPPPPRPGAGDGPLPVPVVECDLREGVWTDVAAAGEFDATGKLSLVRPDGEREWLLCRTANGVRVVGARCPHLGTSLADGFHDDTHVHCPAHAVRFCLTDGSSSSPLLRLPTAQARVRDGRIEVRVP